VCHVLKACCSVASSTYTPHGKKHLNGEPIPTHLLLPNQSFCDDLVGCGFDPIPWRLAGQLGRAFDNSAVSLGWFLNPTPGLEERGSIALACASDGIWYRLNPRAT
jgi:hypothetical protein